MQPAVSPSDYLIKSPRRVARCLFPKGQGAALYLGPWVMNKFGCWLAATAFSLAAAPPHPLKPKEGFCQKLALALPDVFVPLPCGRPG